MRILFSLIIIYMGFNSIAFCNNEFPSLKIVDPTYMVQANSSVIISNVPPLREQGAMGICYAHVAAILLEAEDCKVKKNSFCNKISDKDQYSAMDLAQFGGPPRHENESDFTFAISEGGSIGMVTQRIALKLGYSVSESCLSYKKIFKNIPNIADQLSTLQALHKMYDEFKKNCPNCESEDYEKPESKRMALRLKNEIYDELNLNFTDYDQPRSDQIIWNAFTAESYEKFFYKLAMDNKCTRMANATFFYGNEKVSVQFYPSDVKVKGNYEKSISTIKSVLLSGRPIGLGNICLDETPHKECVNTHAVVINGYRKVCNNKNQCIDVVKVMNTWGQKWQDEHDDGWLNAKLLLDSTGYQSGSLTWFEDKEK